MEKKTFKVWVEYESEIMANTQAEAEDIFQRLFNIHDMLINSIELKKKISKEWITPLFFGGLVLGLIIMGVSFYLTNPTIAQKTITLDIFKENCRNESIIDSSYNSTTQLICDKGNKIDCNCLEEYCPIGTRWLDGSKVCYDNSKSYGIIEGIGCKKYNCNGFIYELNSEERK